MDYFKIIVIIFMIFVLYKLYQNDVINENFESTPSVADDWTAVNQLAQISRQLMNGSLTVPGGLTISGNLITNGSLTANNISTTGTLNAGATTLTSLTVNNRNILSELDALNNRWSGNNLTVPGKLTVQGGSKFSGGTHLFNDSGSNANGGSLQVGTCNGLPGICANGASTNLVQIGPFTSGSQSTNGVDTGGMIPDQTYDFLRSQKRSYAVINNNNTGNFGMTWENNNLYWTYLSGNSRWDGNNGALAS